MKNVTKSLETKKEFTVTIFKFEVVPAKEHPMKEGFYLYTKQAKKWQKVSENVSRAILMNNQINRKKISYTLLRVSKL